MPSDLKIIFYKSNMNLESRLKIIILRIFQSMRARNKIFIHFINFQISFSSVIIIVLLNLFIKIIIILNSFSKNENLKMKLITII